MGRRTLAAHAVTLGGGGGDVGGVEEAAGGHVGPERDGVADGGGDGGGDQAEPVAREPLGGGAREPVDGAVARALALDVALEEAQHPHGVAVYAAEHLGEKELGAVAFGARVGVVTGVPVNAADAARVVERPGVSKRRAAVDIPSRLLQRAAEGEVVSLVG